VEPWTSGTEINEKQMPARITQIEVKDSDTTLVRVEGSLRQGDANYCKGSAVTLIATPSLSF
jgi:hypothetical protein